jgi:hypothetical protein
MSSPISHLPSHLHSSFLHSCTIHPSKPPSLCILTLPVLCCTMLCTHPNPTSAKPRPHPRLRRRPATRETVAGRIVSSASSCDAFLLYSTLCFSTGSAFLISRCDAMRAWMQRLCVCMSCRDLVRRRVGGRGGQRGEGEGRGEDPRQSKYFLWPCVSVVIKTRQEKGLLTPSFMLLI